MRWLPLLLLGCTAEAPLEDGPSLADIGLLGWDGESLTYAEGVVPYELATPLFSDYAVKARAMVLPDGEVAQWVEGDAVLDFPIGTRLLKTFLLPADLREPTVDLRILETRVLTRRADRWEPEPWLWDEAGQTAAPAPGGEVLDLSTIGLDGEPLSFPYLVPQRNQCADCHELKVGDERVFTPIGPKLRHLNRPVDHGMGEVHQLEHLLDRGVIADLPATPDELDSATLAEDLEGVDLSTLAAEAIEEAARDYLDINCAHCHNPQGTEGVSSQLFLHRGETDPFHLGVCKRPGSAGSGTGGLTFDIVPGDHTQSILYYRMATEQPGAMMPDIGRTLTHTAGIDLIARWIDGMTGDCE